MTAVSSKHPPRCLGLVAVELFVNGTLMRGLELHGNLKGAEFLGACRTMPVYRLYSIGDVHPGMCEVAENGVSVAGGLYRVPPDVLRRSTLESRPTSPAEPFVWRTAERSRITSRFRP